MSLRNWSYLNFLTYLLQKSISVASNLLDCCTLHKQSYMYLTYVCCGVARIPTHVEVELRKYFRNEYLTVSPRGPYVASGWRRVVTDDLERIWKEAGVAWSKHYLGICLERPRKTTARVASDPTEFRASSFPHARRALHQPVAPCSVYITPSTYIHLKVMTST